MSKPDQGLYLKVDANKAADVIHKWNELDTGLTFQSVQGSTDRVLVSGSADELSAFKALVKAKSKINGEHIMVESDQPKNLADKFSALFARVDIRHIYGFALRVRGNAQGEQEAESLLSVLQEIHAT